MEVIKVFKFGGAYFTCESMLNSQAFLREEVNTTEIIFVVSAKKGMTRLLNLIVKNKIEEESASKNEREFAEQVIRMSLEEFERVHIALISNLLLWKFKEVALEKFREDYLSLVRDVHDSSKELLGALIPSYGEKVTSKIFSVFLESIGITGKLFSAPQYLHTNEDLLDARLSSLDTSFLHLFKQGVSSLVTQGFIGDYNGHTTLLGLDGSDLSAAYFAGGVIESGISASVTFWKDVKGFYKSDPVTSSQDYRMHMSIEEYRKLQTRPIRLDAVEYALAKNIPVYMGYFPDPSCPLATVY